MQPPVGEHGSQTGWTVVSYLLTGMLFYGGIGWLLGRWVDLPVLFPVGMLFGIVLSTALVIFRYGRP
jgi:ATP synthase protein I